MGCCESHYRKTSSYFFGVHAPTKFSFKDVVPIKYHHYLKEYEFEKNLPSVKERTSRYFILILKKFTIHQLIHIEVLLVKNRFSGKRYVCKSISYFS